MADNPGREKRCSKDVVERWGGWIAMLGVPSLLWILLFIITLPMPGNDLTARELDACFTIFPGLALVYWAMGACWILTSDQLLRARQRLCDFITHFELEHDLR